jgi:hypothetical protein
VLFILSARIEQFAAPAWLAVACFSIAAASVTSALAFGWSVVTIAVCGAACLALVVWNWTSVPEAFQSAPGEATATRIQYSSAATLPPWWAILRSMCSWQLLVFLLTGLLWDTSDWIFGTVYVMLAYNQMRMNTRWTAALPISRRTMLAVTVLPLLVILAGSRELRTLTWSTQRSYDMVREGDPKHFRVAGTLDVFVAHEFWQFAPQGRVPVIRAPWGEEYPEPLRVLGQAFYNPYAVGATNHSSSPPSRSRHRKPCWISFDGPDEETAACSPYLCDASRRDNSQKFFKARRNDPSPNRIKWERHSLFNRAHHRSAKAFKFGLREGSMRFTPPVASGNQRRTRHRGHAAHSDGGADIRIPCPWRCGPSGSSTLL